MATLKHREQQNYLDADGCLTLLCLWVDYKIEMELKRLFIVVCIGCLRVKRGLARVSLLHA